MTKAFLDKLYLSETRLDDYVDILEWVANDRKVLCRLKAHGKPGNTRFHRQPL